jgi:hypothetical protein
MRDALYTPLGQFFGAYFNQDWMVDDPTWVDVVRRYQASEPPQTIAAASEQLKELLSRVPDDGALKEIVFRDFGCCFSPSFVGLTTRQWLAQVGKMLAAGVTPGAA